MQLSIRAIFVAVLLVAVAGTIFPANTVAIAALPGCLWVAGIAVGALLAGGRGFRCIVSVYVSVAIGGIVGAALAAGAIQ